MNMKVMNNALFSNSAWQFQCQRNIAGLVPVLLGGDQKRRISPGTLTSHDFSCFFACIAALMCLSTLFNIHPNQLWFYNQERLK